MTKKLVLSLLPTVFIGLFLLTVQLPAGHAVTDATDITPLPLVTDPDGRMGMCYGFWPDPPNSDQRPYLQLMHNAGARHDRWDFSWWAIQPNNQSEWIWDGHESIVRAENALGVSVLGILMWTPAWASTYSVLSQQPQDFSAQASIDPQFYAHTHNPLAPAGPEPYNSFPPLDLDQPVFVNGQINPQNYWGYYVYNVARHFDDQTDPALQVNAWEIWNEVESAYFWSGSVGDYCQLLQVAYKAIKGEDGATGGNPDATVLFAGLHYWANPAMYTQVLDCLAQADPGGQEHDYFYDVMSVHFYSRSDNTYDMVNLIKGEMAARNMEDHPIWLTETGAPLYGDASPGQPSLEKGDNFLSIDEEAAYTIQAYANALAAGVARYYFFRANDADMLEPHGLIRNDQSVRPAYVAYQVAARYLKGENQVTRVPTADATRVSLWGTPLGKISVLWNRTPDPVTYTLGAAMPTATLVDRWGVTQTISAVDGTYSVTLPTATANLISDPYDYIVGGDPLIIIETDTVSPTSDLAPLPAVTIGTAVTLTWTASDTGSGIWYSQIQSATSSTGPWTTFADLGQTQVTTQTVFTGEHGVTYYFRARARDRVGNWELYPSSAEISTTVDADTELRWRVDALYNDSNRNGVWDPIGTGSLRTEISLTHVSLQFVGEGSHVITSVISNSWRFTETLLPGTYTFTAEWKDPDGRDWKYHEPLSPDGRVDPLHAPSSNTVGLLLRLYDVYLPLVLSESSSG
jgi:hypothetical protein